MNLPKDTQILLMDSSTFANDLANAIGVQPGEEVVFVTPQFHRTDGIAVSVPTLTPDEWGNLCKLPLERLLQMGFQKWKDDAESIHWLFPGQWYPHIPNGTKILFINDKEGVFVSGETDDDIRFGALAFGFKTEKVTK